MARISTSRSDKKVARESNNSSKKANEPQLLQQSWKNKRKKPANPTRAGILFLAAASTAAVIGAGPQQARAIAPSPHARATPTTAPTATPTGTPNSTILPLESSLFFVLDETISSRSRSGTSSRAHLQNPIVLNGITVAPKGAPVQIQIVQASAAHSGNVDGSVDIFFEPLEIAGGKKLPLTTPTEHLNPNMSVGQQSTQQVEDTVGDIFIPGHILYHMLRSGHNVTLRPGTVIRARTAAAIRVLRGGAISLSTPQPFVTTGDRPASAFSAAPLAMPPGFHPSTPKPTPSTAPTKTP
jgi:hypothetical protein